MAEAKVPLTYVKQFKMQKRDINQTRAKRKTYGQIGVAYLCSGLNSTMYIVLGFIMRFKKGIHCERRQFTRG
jgi:hypothetical protein